MNRWLLAGSALLLGCGSASPAPEHAAPAPAHVDAPPEATNTSAGPPTTRVSSANFGGLIRGIQGLAEPTQHAELFCLLGLDGEQAALGTLPLSALSVLPEAPMHLAESLQGAPTHARVLTRWGQRGNEPLDLLVATFTALPPQATADPIVVLAITRLGIFVRETDRPTTAVNPLTSSDALLWLLERTAQGAVTVIVTAEAEVESTQVHALLRSLPSSVRHVALGVALAADTRLPAVTAQAPDASIHCPDGLPDPPADAAEGDLPSAAIMQSLSAIHESLQRCLASTSGPGAAGGKVTLALRIVETGRVTDACLAEDAIHDNVLAACITETARTATFPRPMPVGSVDVHIPLSLAPIADAPPRAVCE